jgi:Raf kinase inhibitor-like YbhB/YbcL family protein
MRSQAPLSSVFFVLLIVAGPFGCKKGSANDPQMSLQVESPSFRQGDSIPKQFTCDGPNISPALSWQPPPANTRSLALIVSDPDAPLGSFVHWIIYNLPPETRNLTEHVPTQEQLPDGSAQGQNDNDTVGYWGPCPPGNSPHRYLFTLYALDSMLNLSPQVKEKQLTAAMKGHILAAGQLMGRYHR